MEDRFALARFLRAQESGEIYTRALAELRAGRKESHWMWFVFPQLAGLGHSEMARRYAIGSLEEARAYLEHPLLGERLSESARALLAHRGLAAETIMGAVDALKLRSSMTLFARAAGERDGLFEEVLASFFTGSADERTLALLAGGPDPAGAPS